MCVYVCVWLWVRGFNDCTEWKTEKCCKSTNIGKLRTTRAVMAALLYVPPGSRIYEISSCCNFVGHRLQTLDTMFCF